MTISFKIPHCQPSKAQAFLPTGHINFPSFLSSTLPNPSSAFTLSTKGLSGCCKAPSVTPPAPVTPYVPFAIWLFKLTVTYRRTGGARQANAPGGSNSVSAPTGFTGLRERRVLFALPGQILSSNNNKRGKSKEKRKEGQLPTR